MFFLKHAVSCKVRTTQKHRLSKYLFRAVQKKRHQNEHSVTWPVICVLCCRSSNLTLSGIILFVNNYVVVQEEKTLEMFCRYRGPKSTSIHHSTYKPVSFYRAIVCQVTLFSREHILCFSAPLHLQQWLVLTPYLHLLNGNVL